jgi:hypothetical protein
VRFSFTLDAHTYRLRRVDEWRQIYDEYPVPPHDAATILKQAAAQHQDNAEIVHLLETAIGQLAGLHMNGVLVLLRVQPHRRGAVVPKTGSASTPSALKPPPPAEAAPPTERTVMGDDQAAALKQAAAAGVPFCEECARAAAAGGGPAAA